MVGTYIDRADSVAYSSTSFQQRFGLSYTGNGWNLTTNNIWGFHLDEVTSDPQGFPCPVSGQVKAESKAKADQMLADMKKRRDEFQAKAKAQAQAGEAAMQASKAQLESQWHGFEAQVKTYFETVGKQVEQQQATFRDVAAAQAKAWREVAETFHSEAAKIVSARSAALRPLSSR